MPKALVIGSGIAGIAAAIRLKSKGFDVTVYEKNSYLGGKLTAFQLGDYRFDAGPSLFTLPHLVKELFACLGETASEHFQYIKHPTACHYFFEDGTFLPFYGDKQRLFQAVEETLNVSSKPLEKHLERSQYIFEKTNNVFLEQSLHKVSSYISLDILKCIASIPWLGIFTTMHDANEKHLNHPKLVQIFDRYATYNGSNPYQAPGILNIIPHLEQGIGTFFPKHGMHQISMSLVELAKRHGVQFFTNHEVVEIVEEHKRVKGIVVKKTEQNEQFIAAETVVCNSDVKPAYRYLLKNVTAPKKTLEQEPSSSAMIFYWGINAEFPQIDLHNIFFSEDYKTEFEHIFKHQTVFEDPTIYIHCSSKLVKADAPPGKEAWFVMVNVPANSGQDWEVLRQHIRQTIIAKLNRMLNCNIESLIEVEDYLDPIRIEERTRSFAGALYGASSNDRMAAFFRHPNFSKVNGLYFVGGSVHPGGGIPLCLLSAKIATDMIKS